VRLPPGIDQQAGPELLACRTDQADQRIVERLPARAHPRFGIGKAQLASVDRLARGHHLGDRPEAGADPRAAGVHPWRQWLVEHGRIELPRLAVGVAIGAREIGCHQGRAVRRRRREQLVDKTILAAAQAQGIQTGRCHEAGGIGPAGMRRGEHHRHGLVPRSGDRDRQQV
jgi:hypothetical protein